MAASRVPTETPALPPRRSLRAKAFAATLGLVLYIVLAVAFVSVERGKIYAVTEAQLQVSRHEKALVLTMAAVESALVEVAESGGGAQGSITATGEVALYWESCARTFAALDEFDPAYALLQRSMSRAVEGVIGEPTRANWIELRETLARVSDALDLRHATLLEQRDKLVHDFHRHYDAVTVQSLVLSLTGIVLFGTLVAWFFAALSGDIRSLQRHASQIVNGSRGVALAVRRQDELGHLMHAVNQMSADLDAREKQIELEEQRRAHLDKMTAVGALAAGVAHEVNNPLAVISGTAQQLAAPDAGSTPEEVAAAARVILEQARRASDAARGLAELAAPQPTDYEWLDLNALVRRVVQLMGYDRRYRQVRLEAALPNDLPAVRAPGAPLQQLLMQLATLACDAAAAGGSAATLCIATAHADGRIQVRIDCPMVIDMDAAPVKRSVSLARGIVASLGGKLDVHQDDSQGCTLILDLPVDMELPASPVA